MMSLLNIFLLDTPSFSDIIPTFDVCSRLTKLPNLDDYDIDEQMPQNIDTHYFSLQELSKSFCKSSSNKELSIFHSNIRSLSLHLDELVGLAMNLNQSFDVIGVSETWDSFENPIATNVEIPGYDFAFTRSHSQNGGVGMYVKSNLSASPRNRRRTRNFSGQRSKSERAYHHQWRSHGRGDMGGGVNSPHFFENMAI